MEISGKFDVGDKRFVCRIEINRKKCIPQKERKVINLIDQIKSDSVSARLEKRPSAVFLTTLLSECSKPGFDDGKRQSSNEEVVAILKKFKSNIQETLNLIKPEDVSNKIKLESELEIVEYYLPQMASENQMIEIAKNSETIKDFMS